MIGYVLLPLTVGHTRKDDYEYAAKGFGES